MSKRNFNVNVHVNNGRNKRQTISDVKLIIEENWNHNGTPTTVKHEFSGMGATIRSLYDKDVASVGIKLAMAEAFEQLSRSLKKDAWNNIHSRKPVQVSMEELLYQYDILDAEIDRRIELANAISERRRYYASTPDAIAKREERAKTCG